MIQTLAERIGNFWLRRKIRQRRELTPLDVLRVASSPRLMQEAAVYGVQLTLFLPPSVVLTGLENLTIEGNVRIHGTRCLMLTTGERLHINPRQYKESRFVSAQDIQRHDEEILRQYRDDPRLKDAETIPGITPIEDRHSVPCGPCAEKNGGCGCQQ